MGAPVATGKRRAVVVSEPMPEDVTLAFAAAGLELRVQGDPTAPDVLLAEPRSVSASEAGLEQVISVRISELLARVGDGAPALHAAVIDQVERGLFRAVLGHTANHLGRASKILGLDRNTCARKARAFGLVDEPSRGRKPQVKAKAPATKRTGTTRPRGKKKQ